MRCRRCLPASSTASAPLRTPDGERRQRERARVRRATGRGRAQAAQLWMRHQPLARVDDPAAGMLRFAVRPMLNVDRFAPVAARMVRFTVLATNQFEPCLDELEVFSAEQPEHNVALASAGGRATASGVYANGDSPLHRLEHINDGQFGNARSWISSRSRRRLGQHRVARDDGHRPCRVGPRPRGEISRPAADALQDRGQHFRQRLADRGHERRSASRRQPKGTSRRNF